MTNDRSIVSIKLKRPARDPNQTMESFTGPSGRPAPLFTAGRDERCRIIRVGLLLVGLGFGAGGCLLGQAPAGVIAAAGVIKATDPFWDVGSEAEPLLVEARVSPDDIDKLRLKQPADIRLAADPARATPLLAGTVRCISTGQLTDPRTGASHYLAQVRVDAASLARTGAGVHLWPGTRVELLIKTGQRTVLDELLEPVAATWQRMSRGIAKLFA